MMQKAVIIDDEAKGRLALKEKLKQYCPGVEVVAEASNGKEGIAAIEMHHPQIIFLDIEMPVMNGFEMLNNISDKNFHIIFTTAYDQYAIKAIKYAAFDYLLKPIDIEELKTAVLKLDTKETLQTGKQIELLQQNMQQPKKNYINWPYQHWMAYSFMTSMTLYTWKQTVITPTFISSIKQRYWLLKH